MYIRNIYVKNVRNLKEKKIDLSPNINVFYGKNAQGKTNLLESIYFLSIARSHRTNNYRDMINFDEKEAFIKSDIVGEFISDSIHVYINNNKKYVTINGLDIKKTIELFEKIFVVIFSPEDLELISSGPSIRRKFIDLNLCQINYGYYNNLNKYYRILKQRNTLLKSIRKNNTLKDTLDVWDEQLINLGIKIIEHREEYIEKLSEISNNFHKKITNLSENLEIIYKKNVSIEDYKKKFKDNLDKDIILGNTNYGIHKDDISIFINKVDIKKFGSQGQKRTISLCLKLSKIEYIKQKGITPILLLDDVFSELDETRQTLLLKEIEGLQTILTCTGIEDILKKILNNINITMYEVKNGEIERGKNE
ncbi:MAG: DNA replication/repair protein RecF [Defluviitaleaceae bacterium]|nr:DNA replication/repair protein RecF [Defluviitaleaceae bacterium]